MSRRSKKLKFPKRIDASPADIARVMLNSPPKKKWRYEEKKQTLDKKRSEETGSQP